MIARYALLASRIRQDLGDLERAVERVERAVQARRTEGAEPDLLIDAAALNLHDSYAGLERIFTQIATNVDQSVPTGPDWPRELLRQMTVEIPGLRSRALSPAAAATLGEYLRFRHVVRNVYAFDLIPERVESLAAGLRPGFQGVRAELLGFAAFLDGLADESQALA